MEERDAYGYAVCYMIKKWILSHEVGIPHALTSDDVYRGYKIPAGSTVIANIWAMLHDEVCLTP